MRAFLERFRNPSATHDDWILDGTMTGIGLVLHLIVSLVLLSSILGGTITASWVVALFVGSAVFLSYWLRHHYPELFLIGVFVGNAILLVAPYPTAAYLVLIAAVYDFAHWYAPPRVRLGLIVGLVFALVAPLIWWFSKTFGDGYWMAIIFAAILVAAVITAYSMGRRTHDVEEARVKQAVAEEDRRRVEIMELQAEKRGAEVRIRTDIARELHDIVAHSISVMVVQAEGGRALAYKSSDQAASVLDTIADTGREALTEMRRIVRVLRSDAVDEEARIASPRIAEIPVLAERAGASLTVIGSPVPVKDGLALTIYRVIQEALTNALKHAGPNSRPVVEMRWEPDEVTVTITNKGTGRSSVSDHRGSGLIGMAERVQAHEGDLKTGPTKGGGFKVWARFPLVAASPNQNAAFNQASLVTSR
ncbi:MAG: sensor histidine kinase [Propionibacteriaceae bacterium]|jgi:signal transduction histidine kinase|nr:sensor histidine kinase [Propionibacteriaceae bacterium]